METDGNILKVALLSRYPPDATNIRGGVQAATTYLLKGLARIDNLELHLLTFRHPSWVGPDLFNQNGVCMHLLPPYPGFERLRNYRTYQAILNELLAQIRPDIVHAQGAASDALVALRSGYLTVVTAHGIRREDQKYCRAWGERIRCYFDSVLTEQQVIGRARYLIAISHYVTQYFASRYRPDLHSFFIPNAVDDRYFELESCAGGPVVLFAGRVIPLKKVMDLVQAFDRVARQIPAAQLRIAGECQTDAGYAGSVHGYVQRAGLEKNVHLLGELSQDKILQEYAACSLLALPSAQENAPLVIAQAMAAGKPVVATRVGGVAEMVGEECERGLLIPVGDVEQLARSMLSLLQDPGLRERMGQASRRFARQNYHPDRVAGQTAQAYREIIARESALHG